MRLYLAVAVVLLALVAYTEAQEETLQEKFAKFSEHMSGIGRNVAERAKTAFEEVRTSEFFTTSSGWLNEQVEKFKNTIQGNTQ